MLLPIEYLIITITLDLIELQCFIGRHTTSIKDKQLCGINIKQTA